MTEKSKLFSLEEEVMNIGAKLCTKLNGKIDNQNLEFIAEYFSVNEYGLALDLLNSYMEKDSELLDCSSKKLFDQISLKISEIEKIYKN